MQDLLNTEEQTTQQSSDNLNMPALDVPVP